MKSSLQFMTMVTKCHFVGWRRNRETGCGYLFCRFNQSPRGIWYVARPGDRWCRAVVLTLGHVPEVLGGLSKCRWLGPTLRGFDSVGLLVCAHTLELTAVSDHHGLPGTSEDRSVPHNWLTQTTKAHLSKKPCFFKTMNSASQMNSAFLYFLNQRILNTIKPSLNDTGLS